MTNSMHAENNCLRITFCLHELRPPESTESFFLQQMLIASRLKANGHSLSYFAPVSLEDAAFTQDLRYPSTVRRTWTRSSWFNLARKISWQSQKALRIPYLNFFSNWSYYDAALQALPGQDIVQERYGLYKTGVARACRQLNLPYILFFDGDDLYEHEFAGKPITGLLKWRAQQMTHYDLNTANKILCVSNAAKRRLVRVWGVNESKVIVFPNSVDVQKYQPDPEAGHKIRSSLGIGDNILILFVGGFFHWHDISGLLDSFRTTLQKCPQARLVLVGDGIHRDAMMQRSRDLEIDPYVTFTGAIPHAEIPNMINAADITVAPYKENPSMGLWGSSMKLFEYMACGSAIIASDLGQISEVIQDGQNGLLTPSENSAALSEAITRLVVDPGLRKRLGAQARQDAVENYSWEGYISRLEEVYAAVLKEQRSRKQFYLARD